MAEPAEEAEPLSKRETEILERLAAGLSDQQIAAGLFLSHHTVRWYNRQIYDKLRVASRTQAVARARELGLLKGTAPAAAAPRTLFPVPTTPFIGRGDVVAEVKQLLERSRLLTLSGAGGTGKTRLALHVAAELAGEFTGGFCFVDLAPVYDPAMVARAIAAALDVREQAGQPLAETLKHVLAGREMLLLIDNFEHVIEAAPLVATLLASAPALKIVVTSREPLRLSGEQEYPVPPLSLPPAEPATVEGVAASEAGTLFVQRSRMVNPRFSLDSRNASAVAQICIRLDGLPLAIELAAARCKVLTPSALLARMESPLDTLTCGRRDAPARHQTLRETIDWSYNLLDEEEKRLFARLALFQGGCSLEAVEGICLPHLERGALDVLASLVDKSLVRQQETAGGEPRFAMLQTVHDYARERLAESGNVEALRRRHAEHYALLAERAEPELNLARQKQWYQRLEAERENIRAALGWSVEEEDVTAGVRLAGALCWYWYVFGYHIEGLHWTQQLLPRLEETPRHCHARFLIGAAHMMRLRDLDGATPLLLKALDLSRQTGDTYHEAYALVRLGSELMGSPEGVSRIEEGLALFRGLEHRPGMARAHTMLGELYRSAGDSGRAGVAYEEALALCREIGDTRGTLVTLLNLTFVARHQGDHGRAGALARQALELAAELELGAEMAECLVAFAGTLGEHRGRPLLAARLLGAAENALLRLGAFYDAPDRQEFDGMIAAVRGRLPAGAFDAAWSEGRQMPLEQAVSLALAEPRG